MALPRSISAAPRCYTVAELAVELGLSARVVEGMLAERDVSIFPGAFKESKSDEDGGAGWRIPARAVTAYLRRRVEPLFTYQEVADILGVHKVTVQHAAAAFLKGDQAGFETVELLLPGVARRMPRITLSELLRHIKPLPSAAA
jgi:predicted transcriptional regulator